MFIVKNPSTARTLFFLALSVFFIGSLIWAYAPALNKGLLSLDDSTLINIPQLQQGFSLTALKAIFTPGTHTDYQPVRDLSYLVEFEIFGQSPIATRLIHLGLLIGAAIFSSLAFRNLTFPLLPVLSVSALYLAHPFHVETISWVSARKDVLALFFASLSFWLFTSQRKRLVWLSPLFLFLSLGSKVSFVFLPVLPVLFFFLRGIKPSRSQAVALGWGFFVSIFWGLTNTWYYSRVAEARLNYSFVEQIKLSLASFGKMMSGLLIPTINILDPENFGNWIQINTVFVGIGAAYWLLLGAMFIYKSRRRSRLALFPLCILTLYLGFPGVLFPHKSLYSVRFLEVLAIPICWLFLEVMKEQPKKRLTILSGVGVGLLTMFTRMEAEVWSSPINVWEEAVAHQPSSVTLRHALWIEKQIQNVDSSVEKAWLDSACGKKLELPPEAQERDSCWKYLLTSWQIAISDKNSVLAERFLSFFKQRQWTEWIPAVRRVYFVHNLTFDREDKDELNFWSKRDWTPTEQYRILKVAAMCLVGQSEEAKNLLNEFSHRQLLRPDYLSGNIQQLSPHTTKRIEACLN